MARLWILILVVLAPLFGTAAEESLNWQVQGIALSDDVRVSVNEKTGAETLQLPGGDHLVLEAPEVDAAESAAFRDLSAEEQEALKETQRDLMEASTRLLLAGKLSGLSIVNGDLAARVAPTEESVAQAGLEPVEPLEAAAGVDADGAVAKGGRLKSVLKALNEAIVLSTYRAARHYRENRAHMKGLENEFGMQLVLKAELQVGFGKINFTRNYPLVLSLGYKRDTREVVINAVRRSEAMEGGTAMSAGVKVELRHYRKVSTPEAPVEVEGVVWYPPALPGLGLVADSSPRYRAMGLVFGLNVADLVPGLYFANAVNGFHDHVIYAKAVAAPKALSWPVRLSEKLASLLRLKGAAGGSCSAIYAH